MTKPNYLDLLQRRASANSRRLYRAPICLQPELLADLQEAREKLHAAERDAAANTAAGVTPRRKLSDTSPVHDAKAALADIEAAVREVSIILVMEGRTSTETVNVVKQIPISKSDTDADDVPERDPLELNKALVMDAYVRAEDVDRNILTDITRDQIEALLPTLTSGEMTLLVQARNIASSAPDFPTLRRS